MIKNTFFLFCAYLLLQSCASGWYSVKLDTENQPIELGPSHLTLELDTLGLVSGFAKHDLEEETSTQYEHGSITFDGYDRISESLDTTIYRALEDDPDHFIADGEYLVKVERGMHFGKVLFTIISSMFADGEPDFGTYSIESISFEGIVYKVKKDEDEEE